MTPRIHCTYRFGAATLLAGALAGCASPPPSRSTMDRIGEEFKSATAPKSSRAAATPASAAPPASNLDLALLPPLEIEKARPQQAIEPRFDLSVANAPAQQVFLSIASGSRYSILVPPEVTGTITVNLKDVTVREALDALREMYGYEYRNQGNQIYIQPNTRQTRIFQINYLAGKRLGTADMRVTSGSITAAGSSGQPGTSSPSTTGTTTPGSSTSSATSSRITSEWNGDFWGELLATLTSIVGNDANHKVVVNPMSGVVVVTGMPSDIRAAENYLKVTQLVISRQVMIEAKIIEVQLNDSFSSGVNWAAFKGGRASIGQVAPGTNIGNSGALGTGASSTDPTAASLAGALLTASPGTNIAASAAAAGSLFGLAFQSRDFSALLSFLETQGSVQVISSPRIASLNNQPALLKVGSDDFHVTGVSTSTTSSGSNNVTTPTLNFAPFFSGIALDITPQIDDNGTVTLRVHPTVGSVGDKVSNLSLGSLGNYSVPLASSVSNESETVVRVQDGYVVAIGGLMKMQQSSAESGLPGTVGTAAGAIAGQIQRSSIKSELVMLLKPTIIRGASDWQADLAETQERLGTFDRAVGGR